MAAPQNPAGALSGGLDTQAPASGTVYEAAARTASPRPVIIGVPTDARALIVVLNVTAITGNTATLTISGVDRASNTVWTLLASSAVGVAQTILRVSPDLTGSANAIAKEHLPAEVQIAVANSDTASITYSVGVHFTI